MSDKKALDKKGAKHTSYLRTPSGKNVVMLSANALSTKQEYNLYGKNWVDDKAVAQLCRRLKGNATLSFLGFRNCTNVSDKGVGILAKLLSSEQYRPTALKKLILEFTGVGDAGVVALASCLACTALERLDFGQCTKVGDPGVLALATALHTNSTLRILVLTNCKYVTDVGGAALIDMLQHNRTLKTVNINGTGISSGLRRQIQAALKGR